MPQSDHLPHLCPIIQVCPWSRCPFGQWAADEATCEQGGEHLLLPSTTVVPTPHLCNPECNVTCCDLSYSTSTAATAFSPFNLPTSDIAPLQCVQNTVVRLALDMDHKALAVGRVGNFIRYRTGYPPVTTQLDPGSCQIWVFNMWRVTLLLFVTFCVIPPLIFLIMSL